MDESFRSLHDLNCTIQDSLSQIISPRLATQNKIRPLQELESLFVQACLRKEKGKSKDGQDSAEFDNFIALQATFECNIISHLISFITICNTRLQQLVVEGVDMDTVSSATSVPHSLPNEDYCEKLRPTSPSYDSHNEDNISPKAKLKQEAQSLCLALNISASLIQGIVLNHAASKVWIGRRGGLEVIVDLLLVSRYFCPSSQDSSASSTSSSSSSEKGLSTTLTSVVLDTLLCILAPSLPASTDGQQLQLEDGVNALRNFEEVQGLQAVVKILKRKGSGRAVRMKCLEFLYFYLLDETSPTFTGPSATVDSYSSTADSNALLPRSTDKCSPEKEQCHSPSSSALNSTSIPSYLVPRNLHNRSQSQGDLPVPSMSSTLFTKSHTRTPSSRTGSGNGQDYKPHSRNTKRPFLPILTSASPNTPDSRPERPERPPTPMSRYGSTTYAFSSGSSDGTFSTSSISGSRTPSRGVQPHLRSHSRPGSIARSPSTRSNSPEKVQKHLQTASEGGGSVPSSRSVSSSSAASAFSAGSETSTAPSSVHSSPRKHTRALVSDGDEDATEKEEERKGHRRSHSTRSSVGLGPGGIGLGRPGVSCGTGVGGTRAQTPHAPQPYIDFVPATPASKVKSRRTADGPSTPAPKLGHGVPATHFAKTPAPVKMKKAESESIIGVAVPTQHGRTKSALGRASSLGDMDDDGAGDGDWEREREKERRKEEVFWDFEAQSPQKTSLPDRISSDHKNSSSTTGGKPQTRTTKEKTAILGTMLGNVDALVRSLEGVRLG
ncbi:hypothetical protein E1B28_004776 [Marasmius oreades]|uniref:Uncharacterized protein n=1 Tax=Marasmius oreades TaxID=181124 RepID=A0A9P7UZC7_9AGAR|nr:uncharacterized protein E1B28_004776 [Marasmius oreades]KAG7097432.1 hypothetical protein E1B28_004776 [Marasmius oreades]